MTNNDEERAQEASEEGNRLFKAGDFVGALAAYNQSLELRPDDPDTLSNRGAALGALGRNEEALAAYDRSLGLSPDDPDTHYNRGAALGSLGRHEDALAAFERSSELRSNDPVTHYSRGVALGNLGRYEEALAAYDQSLTLRSDNPDTHYNRGIALSRLGHHEEAVVAYDRALALRPDHPDTHYSRGNALARLDRHKEALAAFDLSLELRSEDPNALGNRGVALERLGRYTEALASLNRALQLEAHHPNNLNSRGVALDRLGLYRQAAASFQEAGRAYERSGSRSALPHANRGKALYRLGWFHEWHLPQAVEAFRRALDLDEENLSARNGLGVCLLELGDPAGAAVEFLLGAEHALDDPDFRYNYAVACQRDGRVDRAKAEFARILDEHPAFEPARRALDKLSAPPRTPDMWEWWTGGSTGRGVLGFGLLAALAVLVGSPIVYLVFSSLDGPALPWQYYVAALAVVAGALVLPAIRQFRAFGVELEPQPPRAAEAQLEPLLRARII